MRKIVTFVLAIAAFAAVAQVPDMEPGPELKKLSWMVGEWSGKMAMDMEGTKFDSVQSMKVDWDGKFLRSVSTMDMMGMKMTESMYIGYDGNAKKYVCYSFTNFSSFPRIERGGFEGDKFVTISDPWAVEGMPEATVSRATVWLAGKELKVTLDFKQGDKWTPVGNGSMTKKS